LGFWLGGCADKAFLGCMGFFRSNLIFDQLAPAIKELERAIIGCQFQHGGPGATLLFRE